MPGDVNLFLKHPFYISPSSSSTLNPEREQSSEEEIAGFDKNLNNGEAWGWGKSSPSNKTSAYNYKQSYKEPQVSQDGILQQILRVLAFARRSGNDLRSSFKTSI